VDCLVCSAYPRTSDWHLRFEEIPLISWNQNFQNHLGSYFVFAQKSALLMKERKRGNILFFSSIYGLTGPRFEVYEGLEGMTMPAAYAAIKGGLSNFTKYLASYLGPFGVRVNAICPGGVKNGQNEKFIEAYEKIVPLRRMAEVDDVVGPVMFLLSDDSKYVSGVNLPVDGGWLAL
jgi:NAD(P)-dependent dehydrogenase (short-subunit alcohol dehydrogenase family)